MTVDQQKLDALVGRLFGDLSAGYGGVMVSLGDKLGLYKAMAGAGPLSSQEVARRSGCGERYVREWLNSQVAGGYVDYHPTSATYELTPEQAAVLADDTSPVFLPHAWQVVASMWADEPKSLAAFKTGKGVSWGEHDERLFCGVAAFFRNAYSASLVKEWLPALTGVTEKLAGGRQGGRCRLRSRPFDRADGQGLPQEPVLGLRRPRGVDCGGPAGRARGRRRRSRELRGREGRRLRQARLRPDLLLRLPARHGPAGRCRARMRQAPWPRTARSCWSSRSPGDRVEDNINPVGRLYYAASTTMCCAHAISEKGTHVLGAQAGPRQLEEVLKSAGLGTVRRAAETPFNLIIEARR